MNFLVDHLGDHLRELRRRLVISFAAVVICSGVAYIYSRPISHFLMKPLFAAHPALARLVYTNLTEAFVSYIKVSLLAGLIASFPVLLYQTWMFMAPGLHPWEKKVGRNVVFWATLLFGGGVFFAYFAVMPELLEFLMGFTRDGLEPLPRLESYLTFVVRTSLAFGLAFEIPFLMVMATRAGLVARGYFSSQRKYFYLLIVVLAFLLAAGDPLSAVLLSCPLFCLYEAGIGVIRIFS